MPDPTSPALAADVRSWAERTLGAAVLDAQLISGGNRHGTWGLSLATPAGEESEVVLRVAGAEDAPHAGPSPLQREAAAYRALAGTGLPVPQLLDSGVVAGGDVVLVSRLPGDATLPPPGSARDVVGQDLMVRIAALHAVDVRSLDLGPLASDGPGPQADRGAWVRAELRSWEDRYRASDRLDPLIECALAWCRASLPDDDRPPVLVHGDVGPGNFLHDGTRVTGLVDWELAHLGDPLDDLAGFGLRTVHAQVGGFAELAATYGASAGDPIDPSRLAFHQVMAALRVVIIRHLAPAVEADIRQANRMISTVLHRRLLVEALHLATARPVPPPVAVPAAGSSPHTRLFAATAELLRHEVLPHTDAAGGAAVKAVARIVKHLSEVDRLGPAADADVRDALRAILGEDSLTSVAALRHTLAEQLRDGIRDPLDALPALAVDAAWDTALLRPAMGALADRPLPSLTGTRA